MKWFEKDIEIRYADTDQMGVVHHAVYPLYCEMARIHVCAALGMPYHELEQCGIYMMLADLYCRYKAPARMGDRLIVRAAVSRLKKRMIEFQYEIMNQDSGRLLFTGHTRLIISNKTQGAMSLPEPYFGKLQAIACNHEHQQD